MFTAAFWKATAERVVGTFGAVLLAALGLDSGVNLADADWGAALTLAGYSAGVTLLKCLSASAFTPGPGPSLIAAEVLSPPARPQEG